MCWVRFRCALGKIQGVRWVRFGCVLGKVWVCSAPILKTCNTHTKIILVTVLYATSEA